MSEIIEIDTKDIDIPDLCGDVYKNRTALSKLYSKKDNSDVTICIQCYNNIDKTKRCIESVIKYSTDVDYDLLLIDNGSTDETFEYLKKIDHHKKKIIRITENKGAIVPHLFFSNDMFSKYVVCLVNDLIVTTNWLSNLIKVIESDPKIGLVNPMSSNVSNYQDPGIVFSNYEEMQEKARLYNISDSKKWHERLRIITLGALYRKECILSMGIPIADIGFAHNFSDDDVAFKIRRSGYKVVLAGDTWIHHDDDKSIMSDEKKQKMYSDIAIGRKNFQEKYFGIDAWDDVNNYIGKYLTVLNSPGKTDKASVLGIDVKCGTPILEIKNRLRWFDVFDTECSAYTTCAKYMIDLQTVCGATNVFCGEINGFSEVLEQERFNYIVIGDDINTYSDPFRILRSAYRLLKPNGQLFFSLYNTNNIFNFAYSIGLTDIHDMSHATNYTVEEIINELMKSGYDVKFISAQKFESVTISEKLLNNINLCFDQLSISDRDETMFRLTSQHYYLVINRKDSGEQNERT